MAIIEPSVLQGMAAMAGVEDIDTFAASVMAFELETRMRQIVGEAQDAQRHSLSPRLTGTHVRAALSRHNLGVRTGPHGEGSTAALPSSSQPHPC